MNVVHFRHSRRILVLYAILAAGMIGFGALLIATASPWSADVPEGIFIIVFSICAVIFVGRVWFKTDPIVEVDAAAIRDKRISDKRIPWNDVIEINGYGTWENRYFRSFGWLAGATGTSNRLVGIIVKEPLRYYRMPNPFLHVLNRVISWMLGYPLLSMNMGPLDGTYDDLSETIRRFTAGKPIKVSL